MKIWITVPSRFTEISNGRLIRKTQLQGEQTRYEWFVSYPINNYNVTFNIGMYTHYRDLYMAGDTLTIDYYVMPYNLERARSMFAQVKPMLDCFEKHFGKYPFRRDGFTLVESLYPMEHQSGVCIGKITQQNSGDTNPLLWHESAHEWWGNAISCQDMADLWIHEAFATYAEALMIESLMGKDAAIKFISDLQPNVKNREPVIGVYDVNHIFYDIGDMYGKGCLMLNTFRHVLNDDKLWFALLHGIQQHFRYKTITSDQLIAYINHYTGNDYTYFFDQYLKHTTLPKLKITLKEAGTDLTVKYRWQATVEGFRMPVLVTTAADQYNLIYPVQEWNTVTLKHMTADEFEVDEDRFFIEVEEVE
jgi:aminopeptidase N